MRVPGTMLMIRDDTWTNIFGLDLKAQGTTHSFLNNNHRSLNHFGIL